MPKDQGWRTRFRVDFFGCFDPLLSSATNTSRYFPLLRNEAQPRVINVIIEIGGHFFIIIGHMSGGSKSDQVSFPP